MSTIWTFPQMERKFLELSRCPDFEHIRYSSYFSGDAFFSPQYSRKPWILPICMGVHAESSCFFPGFVSSLNPRDLIIRTILLLCQVVEYRNVILDDRGYTIDFRLAMFTFLCKLVTKLTASHASSESVDLNDIWLKGGVRFWKILNCRNLGGYNQSTDTLDSLDHQVSAAYKYEFQDMIQARGLHGNDLRFSAVAAW